MGPKRTTVTIVRMATGGLALSVALSLPLASCAFGSDAAAPASASAPVSPAPATTPDPTLAWADGVCTAAAGVRDEIASVAQDLVFDPMASGSAVDQVQGRLDDRSAAIDTAVDALGSAIGSAPLDVPAALEFATALQARYVIAQRAIAEATSAVDGVATASDPWTLGLNVAAAIVSVRAAAQALGDLASAVSTSATTDAVSEAFTSSAACQSLTSG
ncbi:MAG: hypothetical protein F2793_06035 [Actinobacteria bacterium]|uniref:Unannotated protein n=1 Tax=freshwater metagenome TaxID=449393 RepID=A0A6J7EJR2_9ZZZZ|nr:hypothetical protein [Actinomycetota bacterium]